MTDATGPASSAGAPLHAALLDFLSAPGRYHVASRQPALLFGGVREILQTAVRGAPAGTPESRARSLRSAAAFFVRTALLRPDADHYQVLGLAPGMLSADLKERYRLLMRLIHPDFAAGASTPWPRDAAARVNRAYDVLSSPALRREYDAQLAASTPRVPVAANMRMRVPTHSTHWHSRRIVCILVSLATTVVAISVLWPSSPGDYLVQRPASEARPLPRAQDSAMSQAVAVPATAMASIEPLGASVAVPVPAPATPAARAMVTAAVSLAATSARRQRNETPAPLVIDVPRSQEEVVAARPQLGQQPASLPAAANPAANPHAGTGRPSLREVQPMLTRLLQMLESGSGEQLIRLVDGEGARSASAQALMRRYDRIAAGERRVRLAQARFVSTPRHDSLWVTGRIRLQVGETAAASTDEALVLRAEFVLREGHILLTGVGEAPE